MISNIGIPGLILILILALMVFGPSKLPEIGRAFGRTLTEFKGAAKEFGKEDLDEGNEKTLPAGDKEGKRVHSVEDDVK